MISYTGNVDYVSIPVDITFPTGETAVLFNISTMNETYILTIAVNPASLINSSVNIRTSNASVIIIDDDRK